MELQLIADSVIYYCAMIGPAITAIAGVIALLRGGHNKTNQAIKEVKEAVAEVKDEQTFRDVANQLKENGKLDQIVIKQQNILIDRITRIEKIMERVEQASKTGAEYDGYKSDVDTLSAYYSGNWRKDFEMDEEGIFPEDMKRGVLSEDGLYDLLEEAEK
jgi:hypothetical protein